MAAEHGDFAKVPFARIDVAPTISYLWNDEGCRWSARFDEDNDGWAVALEWWTDSDVPHGADRCRLTWEFWGDTVVEAMDEAHGWLRDLALWTRCDECGGEGTYRTHGGASWPCADCDGTGLRYPPEPALSGSPKEGPDGR